MSEPRAIYSAGPITLDQFRGQACALPFRDPGYMPPTPEQVDALVKAAGWSQNDVAKIAGVNHGPKGSPTVRRWRSPATSKEHRDIPYSAWRLLLLASGVVDSVG